MKLKYLLRLKNINQKELAIKTGLSEPLISKFNNYVCLPTPKDMKTICKTLKCDVLDIYEKDEIQFVKPKKKRKASELDFYRLTVTLPGHYRKIFSQEMLHYIGYGNLECLMYKVAERILHARDMKKAGCYTEAQYIDYLEEQEESEEVKEKKAWLNIMENAIKKESDAVTPNSNVVS